MCFSKCFGNVFLKTVTAWFKIKLKVESRGPWKTQHSELIAEEIKPGDSRESREEEGVTAP